MESSFAWLLAFALTAIAVVAGRWLAPAFGLVDEPDDRKKHVGNIPLIGGVAIYVVLLVVLALSGQVQEHKAFLVAAAIIVATGIWDDFKGVAPGIRLMIQAASICIVALWGGVYLADLGNILPGGNALILGQLAIPFTIVAGVGLINAFNMTDGLDGLCGSLALVAIGGAIAVATVSGAHQADARMLIVFSGAVAGFLLFNFRFPGRKQAKVFLGDAGSYLLGFTVLYAVMRLSQGQDRAMPPVAALWFCLLPLLDMGGITVRRMLRGLSPFSADREHLHHVFTLAKFSVTATVTMMTAIAVVGVLIGTAFPYLDIGDIVLMAAFLLVAALYLWSILRTWKVLRFFMRSIDRRAQNVGPTSTVDRRRAKLEVVPMADSRHKPVKSPPKESDDGSDATTHPAAKKA